MTELAIETLLEVLQPRGFHVDPFDGPWGRIEAELGTRLPQDYKDIVRIYGLGDNLDFMGAYAPQFWNPRSRLVYEVTKVCEVLRRDPYFGHPIWPEPDGVLPFAGTAFGNYLLWSTRGNPDDWQIVIRDRIAGHFLIYNCGLTEFLAALVMGEITPWTASQWLIPGTEFLWDVAPTEGQAAVSGPETLPEGQLRLHTSLRTRISFTWRAPF
jgi:hypothetical protein